MREMLPDAQEWRLKASCLGLYYLFDMASERGTPNAHWARKRAQRICVHECPVFNECNADAEATDDQWGYRAGITPQLRRRKRKKLAS